MAVRDPPQTVAHVTGGHDVTIGAYRRSWAFDDGLGFFGRDQFIGRGPRSRADPAQRDAVFYIAYSYYRQGWGRVYNDDVLFKEGLAAVDRAVALAPDHRLVVDDSQLPMKTADELRAELQRGLTRDVSDFNPLRVLRSRK